MEDLLTFAANQLTTDFLNLDELFLGGKPVLSRSDLNKTLSNMFQIAFGADVNAFGMTEIGAEKTYDYRAMGTLLQNSLIRLRAMLGCQISRTLVAIEWEKIESAFKF